MSRTAVVIILLIVNLCLGCELQANRKEPASSPADVTVLLKPIGAVIHESGHRAVVAQEVRIEPRPSTEDPFQQALFVNDQKGWASTGHSMYRTSDGGTTWHRLRFQPPEGSRLASVFFIDESQGWLAVTKQIHTQRYGLGNSSKILFTRDGGSSWNEQADFPDEVRIREISFINANEGFAVGARIVDRPVNQGPPYQEMLVLTTADGGTVWTDQSEQLKTAIRMESGSVSDAGRSIRSPSANETFLLTRNGRVAHTLDHGRTWKIIAKLQSVPNGIITPTGYNEIIFDTENKIRVIGGAVGEEGYWGDLVVKDDAGSWISYELMLVPILDALFLSKNEVLVGGFDKRSSTTTGIILFSTDGGKSWTPVYRSRNTEAFISLTKATDNHYYAVSDAGTFLKFALSK